MKITTEAEHASALASIDELINAEEGTPEYAELIELGEAVADWEDDNED